MKGIFFMNTSSASSQPTIASTGLREVMRQHPLFAYFFMAYAFSWIVSIPIVLSEWNFLPKFLFAPFFAIKPFIGPFLAGFIMINITEGKEGVLRMRRSIFQWRAGWKWYAFILLVIPVFFLLGIAVMPGALASFQGLSTTFLVGYPINFIIIFFLGGPLGEEIGWRGYALPRMQQRYGALRASLLLGVVWTFWHLPDFLTSAQHGGPAAGLRPFFANLPIFLAMVMAITLIFTWVSNHTRGSVFMAILLHASINTLGIVVPLFPIPAVTGSELPMLIGWGALALLIVVLTRGRLGYKPGQEQTLRAGETKVQPAL
jgi:membrane protease YdiL (CAAX protease family)